MFLNRASIRRITKLCVITHLTKMNILFDNSLLWIQVCVNTKSSREDMSGDPEVVAEKYY